MHSFTFLSVDCLQIRESRCSDEIMPSPGSLGEKNNECCVIAFSLAKNVGYSDDDAVTQK